MTSFWLKIIAAVTMLIDHTGAVFFPQLAVFHIVGRLSFPIYAFLAAEGASKTHRKSRYLLRLGIFALLSEAPFRLAFSLGWENPLPRNVLFTLLCGVACCFCCAFEKKWIGCAVTTVLASAAQLAGADYGAYGVLAVVFFYLLREEKAGQGISFSLLTAAHCILTADPLQAFSVLGFLPCARYNGERGRDLRWLFYAFYPAHLLLLWALRLLV